MYLTYSCEGDFFQGKFIRFICLEINEQNQLIGLATKSREDENWIQNVKPGTAESNIYFLSEILRMSSKIIPPLY